MDLKEYYKKIKSVDEILSSDKLIKQTQDIPRLVVTQAVRNIVNNTRMLIKKSSKLIETIDLSLDYFVDSSIAEAKRLIDKNLKYVINATGTVLHTNLGRSPLNEKVIEAINEASKGYTNLEMDLITGKRNQRGNQAVDLLKLLTNAEDALIVNNNAAAVLLILSTFTVGKEVIVSRGEQVEVGGSFRIPDVMKSSGTKLVEVGATNKTSAKDYEDAINENTAALMKIHTSNFMVVGFTAEVGLSELSTLGKKYNIPVIHDLGSGSFIDFTKYGLPKEPMILESLSSGADIISFSGDKLLGSTQAGIILGKKKYIEKLRQNQLLRALRVDKLTLAGLSATLRIYLDDTKEKQIPILKMLSSTYDEIHEKSLKLEDIIRKKCPNVYTELIDTTSSCGGGAMPVSNLPTCVVSITSKIFGVQELSNKLRLGENPIVCRIHDNCIFLDTRTIQEIDFETIATKLSIITKNMVKQ